MSNYVPNCKCGRELDHVFQTMCSACQEAEKRHEEFVDTMTANTEAIEEAARAAEDRERDLERAAESAERAAYLTNNPGAYECPTCKMISLKYGASCCPKCQKYVPEGYWQRIREQERLAAERAKEEQRVAEEQRQKWLASPEYAKEVAQKKKSKIFAAILIMFQVLIPSVVACTFIACGVGLGLGDSAGTHFLNVSYSVCIGIAVIVGLLNLWAKPSA